MPPLAEAALAQLLGQLWPRVGANSIERRAVARWQLERLERLVVPAHAGVLMQPIVAPQVGSIAGMHTCVHAFRRAYCYLFLVWRKGMGGSVRGAETGAAQAFNFNF